MDPHLQLFAGFFQIPNYFSVTSILKESFFNDSCDAFLYYTNKISPFELEIFKIKLIFL